MVLLKDWYNGWLSRIFKERRTREKDGAGIFGAKKADVAHCNLNKFKTA
jgi:hypothetical protein